MNTKYLLLFMSAMFFIFGQAQATEVRKEITAMAPGIWRLRFGTPERFTPDTMREKAPMYDAVDHLPKPKPLPFFTHRNIL